MVLLSARLAKAQEALEGYNYPHPFSAHLKDHFRGNRNAGSKDRRAIRQLCYQYFRLAPLLKALPEADKWHISACFYKEEILPFAQIDTEIEEKYKALLEAGTLEEKLQELRKLVPAFELSKIFPYPQYLNSSMQNEGFYLSHLQQPLVWIRIMSGKEGFVRNELKEKGLQWLKEESELTLAFAPETRLDETTAFKKGWFRIQDLSSQSTASFFKPQKNELWWDACTGAGGKSLALKDAEPAVRLWASDIRDSILRNMQERHRLNGSRVEKAFTLDLRSRPNMDLPQFDGIILDVPCSGSGTWARNPENLLYFPEEQIKEYAQKQALILRHAWEYLKPGHPLVYITCSVYTAENEDVIRPFVEEYGAEIETEKYLEGYFQGAENMFICRLIKK